MVDHPKPGFEALAKGSQLYPQEALLELKKRNNTLNIGIPCEVALQEKRVPLTPGGVSLLVNNGHEVALESGAGKTSKFNDKEYSDAGAKIVYSHKEIFEAELVLKVEPPTHEEISYMKPGKTLISALQTGNLRREYFEKINQKKITALGYELIEDKVGGMPVLRAMSEIAGSTVMLIAGEYLSSARSGKGIILGGITGVPPTRVVILGAGTVAEFAARAALGLGVDIQVFDNHLYKLRRVKHTLGHQVFTSTLEPNTLRESLKHADVVIGAMRTEKGKSRFMVTEDLVSQMKPGSVIIDVSIDQGGCFETTRLTTHENPVYTKFGVIHYCVPNIASRVARTATTALSNIFTPILLQIADTGGIDEMIFSHKSFMRGVYAYKGYLTNTEIATKIGMKSKDLNLLLAARF
jgi:alanine dehydrogenase